MATYLLVNVLFLIVTVLAFRMRIHKPSKKWCIVFIALLVMTAIFDSMIVYFDIVGYDPSKILGVTIGYAPVEDFFYAIFAAIIVPLLWNRLGKKHA